MTWSAKTGRWYVFDNAYWRGLLSDARATLLLQLVMGGPGFGPDRIT